MPEQMTDAEVMANLEPWAQVAWADVIMSRPRDATDDEMHPYLRVIERLCRSLAEHRRALRELAQTAVQTIACPTCFGNGHIGPMCFPGPGKECPQCHYKRQIPNPAKAEAERLLAEKGEDDA